MMDKIFFLITGNAPTDPAKQVTQVDGGGTNLQATVNNVLSVVFTLVGVIAVIVIIIGGVYYITSNGDAEKIKKGKNTIMYGIIGLIVTLLAFAIVSFVLNSF
ncbi:MAG: pilin [Candidatus Saccharibacteria bacterium]|jgi:glucose uptake protein GlcU|nr:pilin [Candidatus Saccharibacteria bacterium]